MAAQIAVILNGCGFKDGSEIHESVLTLLAIARYGAVAKCLSLRKPQASVVNHLTLEDLSGVEPPSMIEQSARIARGLVQDLNEVSPTSFDAVILPGGFGTAKNLCDFASKGAALSVDPDVERFLRGAHTAGKPIGAICIAPVILAKVFGSLKPKLTLGADGEAAQEVTKLGVDHVECGVTDCVVDQAVNLVSTPAYMYEATIDEVEIGISKLVKEVLRLIRA